jgi:CHAD domain-containing protein
MSMNPEKLFRRWENRLQGFQRSLRKEYALCKRTGKVESIHRLRVILRRLRTYLRLGNAILGKAKVKAFRDWSTRISDAVGPVRDLDVTLALLKSLPNTTRIGSLLRRQRKQLWRAARPQLTGRRKLPLGALTGRPAPRGPKRLGRKFARTFEGDRGEIMRFTPRLDTADAEPWHEIRRDLRRIRYLRELCLPFKAQAGDPLLRDLIHLQELLGNAQNCAAALAALPDDSGADAGQTRARLEQERRGWLRRAEKALAAFQRGRRLKQLHLEGERPKSK